MVRLVLENDNFEFNCQHYMQVDGMAIGSRLGKNYACLYMRKLQLLKFPQKPYLYKRYIDDGIGFWTEGENSLLEFANHANSIHPRIKVTLRWSKDKIEFHDTWVKLKGGKIETDLFCKETDKHLYLQRDSDHPKHTKACIPYGLGLRLKRICSKDKSYEEQKGVLQSQLIRRGYKEGMINREFKKVDKVEREDALEKKNRKKQNDRVPLVLTYSSHLPNIQNIVRPKMHLLYRSEKMKKVFKKPTLVAYCRGGNLADVLIHGKLNKMMNKEDSNKILPCGEEGCRVCPHVNASRSFYSTNGDEYEILKDGDSDTRNVVYLLSCKMC